MSLPNELLPVGLLGTGASADTGYLIERSLRFNSADSAYLSRTPASAGNRKTWTWAGWVKLAKTSFNNLLECVGPTTPGTRTSFMINDLDKIDFFTDNTSSSRITTTQVFRDYSAWYHIVLAVDTIQATASNRVKIYVNGSQITTFSTATYPSQNLDTQVNNTQLHTIGRVYDPFYANMYLADVHLIDGQALDPTSFGEFDDNGIWQPIEYAGTYGTNGFHLPFSDNSTAAALGTDTSGNGNTWTVNNLSVSAGAGNDSLVDVPTNGSEVDTGAGGQVRGNYCTLNPLDKGGGTLSEGNLQAADGSNVLVRGTISVSSGKWYYECTPTVVSGAFVIGVATPQASLSYLGVDAYGWGYTGAGGGLKYNAGGSATYGSSIAANDVIGVAVDMDAKTLTFYKNNTSLGTAYSNLTGSVAPAFSGGAGSTCVFNFGARSFAYTAPTGFKALCTANLPAPLVTKPSDLFDVKLYTGNGGTQTISGLGFSPDFLWFKARSIAYSHALYDTVRGYTKSLVSNSTVAEGTEAGGLSAFNSDGFSLNGENTVYGSTNTNGQTYVAWCWDAGSSTVTNTAGSISSQVRANASAGFSIVTYTGNISSNQTIGHGLGAAPSLIICKKRSGTDGWPVYHSSLGSVEYVRLESTAAKVSTSPVWASTSPTSTVFTVGQTGLVNETGETYVAYCFAPVVGYSSFGSYTGNGSADGPFVYTGFRPRWILYKNSSQASDWAVYDAVRSSYNVVNDYLTPNTSAAEGVDYTNGNFDILSNGFKIRATWIGQNGSGNTIIYAAFAESPFQYARAR